MVAPVKWAALARNAILCSCWCLFWGGFPYIYYYQDFWPVMALYCWCEEMQISQRKNELQRQEKRSKSYVFRIVGGLGYVLFWPIASLGRGLVIVQNYWINGCLAIAIGIYPCLEIPSILGGIIMIAGGVLSIFAGINGEVGKSMEELQKEAAL